MLKLKLQYFGYLMWTANSLEKILMLETIESKRRRGGRGWAGWITSLTQWTWIWAHSRWLWRTGKPDVLQFMGSQSVGYDWAAEQLSWVSGWIVHKGSVLKEWSMFKAKWSNLYLEWCRSTTRWKISNLTISLEIRNPKHNKKVYIFPCDIKSHAFRI